MSDDIKKVGGEASWQWDGEPVTTVTIPLALGCQCPSAWWGIHPPPCPVHNPVGRVFTSGTIAIENPSGDGEASPYSQDAPLKLAWQCPGCHRWKAPHVDECGCGDG